MENPPDNLIIQDIHELSESMIGQKFGRLFVKEYVGYVFKSNGRKRHVVKCLCDCGKTSYHNTLDFRQGLQSCGCLKDEIFTKDLVTHNKSRAPEYRSWKNMIYRCFDPKDKKYQHYGGRGITVCDRWLSEYGIVNFIEDMGERTPGFTLERKDCDGNYCPENCCWADYFTQNNNRRNVELIEFQGQKLSKNAIATKVGMEWSTLSKRLEKGWDINKSVNEPLR